MTNGSKPDARFGKTNLSDWISQTYGLRIIAGWGFERTMRLVGVVIWVDLLASVILFSRPDLLHPADLGSDTSNYAAFGERLADRQQLYALSPGDRPVPADNPPTWRTPILSPPQMAVPWAAMATLPDAIRFYVPWAIGLAGTIAAGVLFLERAPGLLVLATLPLLHGLAVTAWSGNVNALIAPAALLTWWAGQAQAHRLGVFAAGAMAATLGAVKIGPTLLWAWLIGRRPSGAIAGGLLAVGVLSGVVVWLVGVVAFQDYFLIVVTSASEPSELSLAGLMAGLGLPPAIATLVWLAVAVVLGVVAILSRHSQLRAFAAAAAGLFLLTPTVRIEVIPLALVVAATPWICRSQPIRIRIPVALAACTAIAAIGASVATGGLARSSMQLENATSQTVIVRFVAPGQPASWGYLVQAGQRGIGWSDRTGGVLGPFRVFDTGCRLLAVVDVAPTGGSYRLGSEGMRAAASVSGSTYLPYDSRCSEEMMPNFGVQPR